MASQAGSNDDVEVEIDIPAQPATHALQMIARQSGSKIVFSPLQLQGISTKAVSGRYPLKEALRQMLANSPLDFKVYKGDTIVVTREKADNERNNPVRRRPPFAPAADAGVLTEIEQVIVNARRKEENLQEVPVAVSVISANTLARQAITSIVGLQRFVPGLSITGVTRDNPSYTFRGLTNMAGGSSVVSYFNEVPLLGAPIGSGYSSGSAGPGNFFDLENVQVLLGPQGTLFGQNTVGGAILFVPKPPTYDANGYVELEFGNYNARRTRGAINTPLVDNKLAVRLAGELVRREGFTQVLSSGQKLDDRSYEAGRITVLMTPTERFESSVVANAINVDQQGTTLMFAGFNPEFTVGGTLRTDLYPELPELIEAQRRASPRSVIGVYGDEHGDFRPRFKSRFRYLSNTLTYRLNEHATLKNIIGWQRLQFLNRTDTDGSPFSINQNVTPDDKWQHQLEQFTEELQLQGDTRDGHLQGVLGFYMQHAGAFGPQDNFMVSNGTLPDNPVHTTVKPEALSYAMYAQGTYALAQLTPMLRGVNLSAGFRHTRDSRMLTTSSRSPLGCTIIAAEPPDCVSSGQGSFSEPSWTLSLDYAPRPGALLYVATRRSYVAGGVNPHSFLPGTRLYEPAHLTDVEMGLKSEWRLGETLLRTNIEAYRGEFRQMQIATNLLNPLPPYNLVQVAQNAADAIRQGVEVQVSIAPSPSFELLAMWAYQDNYYTSYRAVGVQVDGPVLAAAPEHKLAVRATYAVPVLPTLGRLSLSLSGTNQSSMYHSTQPSPSPGLREPPHTLFNVHVEWASILGSQCDAALFATNVTDRIYRSGASAAYNSNGYRGDAYGEPRMYGAQLRYRF